ncbi:MAG TPA: hypothetical protein VFK80_11540, partial [Limnochordia bacterium]|nr:hypothetical protein [Limnochordia bacterium]
MAEAIPPEMEPLAPTPVDRREARRRAVRAARRKRLWAACGCFAFIAVLALAIGYHLQTGRWWPAPLGAGGEPVRILVLGSDG